MLSFINSRSLQVLRKCVKPKGINNKEGFASTCLNISLIFVKDDDKQVMFSFIFLVLSEDFSKQIEVNYVFKV